MTDKAKNIEITPELMDALIANPLFQQKMAAVFNQQKPKPVVGFVSAAEVGFPQLSNEQLINQARLLNKNINQSVAEAELVAMG